MYHLRVAALTLAVVSAAAPAAGQAVIRVNEDVNFKFGVLGQFQADWLEDADGEGTQQNLFLRRIRLMFGGQVAKNLTFFFETDAANLGKTVSGAKAITPELIVQDAFGTWTFHKAVAVDFGLMFVPLSRNTLQAAGTLLPIDYGAYTYSTSSALQSTVGRDTGAQARGYVAGNHLEYRLGVFQGHRDAESHDSFRYAGRVQWQLLDPEAPGFFYTGTYLGARKVATIGGGFDSQDHYHAYAVDGFLDHPLGSGAVTAQLAWNRIDGDTTFTQLPKQNVLFFEAGYLFRDAKLTPVFQYTSRNVRDNNSEIKDETKWSLGLNYWWTGHNANVKAAYAVTDPRGATNQRQFTVQLQFFYY